MPRTAVIVVAALALAVGAWYVFWPPGDVAIVKARLQAVSVAVNRSTVDGLAPEARSAQFGAFFTEDVAVDLGEGTAAIRGRDTVMGMAERLQPRIAAFRLEFEDVSVVVAEDGQSADVRLTAEFIRRGVTPADGSLDAREFAVGMRKVGAEWQISHVTAVDTLK